MPVSLERALRVCALCAAATVVAMLAIFVATGVGQDPLQYVHSSSEYARLLLRDPPVLRAAIGLDNIFVVFYASVFVLLGALLLRDGRSRMLVGVAVGLLLLLAILDFAENFHFLVMIARAEQAMPPGPLEIGLQVWESLVKFHVSYLGLFLLGFALPRRNWRERLLSNASWCVQLPVGVLIYVTPPAVAVPLVFARFGWFLVALVLVSLLYPPPGAQPLSGAGAGGSSARA